VTAVLNGFTLLKCRKSDVALEGRRAWHTDPRTDDSGGCPSSSKVLLTPARHMCGDYVVSPSEVCAWYIVLGPRVVDLVPRVTNAIERMCYFPTASSRPSQW